MGVIADLKTRLETIANMTDIKQVVYDRIEEINADSKNSYPYLLFRANKRSSDNYRNKKEYPTYEIDFYLADLFYSSDVLKSAEKEDYITELLDSVVKSISKSDNNYELMNTSTLEVAHDMHNDNVIVAKLTATIKMFSCNTLIDQ